MGPLVSVLIPSIIGSGLRALLSAISSFRFFRKRSVFLGFNRIFQPVRLAVSQVPRPFTMKPLRFETTTALRQPFPRITAS